MAKEEMAQQTLEDTHIIGLQQTLIVEEPHTLQMVVVLAIWGSEVESYKLAKLTQAIFGAILFDYLGW